MPHRGRRLFLDTKFSAIYVNFAILLTSEGTRPLTAEFRPSRGVCTDGTDERTDARTELTAGRSQSKNDQSAFLYLLIVFLQDGG